MMLLKTYIYLMLQGAIRVYTLMLFAYIIFGYFPGNHRKKWFAFLAELCQPPLRWAQTLTKGKMTLGMLDFSPLLVFIGLEILSRLLYYLFAVV